MKSKELVGTTFKSKIDSGIITHDANTGEYTWHWNGAWSKPFVIPGECADSLYRYASSQEDLFRRPPEWDEDEKKAATPTHDDEHVGATVAEVMRILRDSRVVFRDAGAWSDHHSVTLGVQHVRSIDGKLVVDGFFVHPDDAARVAAAFGLPWPAEGGGA